VDLDPRKIGLFALSRQAFRRPYPSGNCDEVLLGKSFPILNYSDFRRALVLLTLRPRSPMGVSRQPANFEPRGLSQLSNDGYEPQRSLDQAGNVKSGEYAGLGEHNQCCGTAPARSLAENFGTTGTPILGTIVSSC